MSWFDTIFPVIFVDCLIWVNVVAGVLIYRARLSLLWLCLPILALPGATGLIADMMGGFSETEGFFALVFCLAIFPLPVALTAVAFKTWRPLGASTFEQVIE